MDIYLDESLEIIDKKLVKVNICAVEIAAAEVQNAVRQLTDLTTDGLRFPSGRKLHLSEMNDAQRSQVVEIISKLPLNAKTFTYYITGKTQKDAKLYAMRRAVKQLKHIHRTRSITFRIEHADEYRGGDLSEYLANSDVVFLLPDAILNVFSKHLNDGSNANTSANSRFYTLLKEKIRLQVFVAEGFVEDAQRNERI